MTYLLLAVAAIAVMAVLARYTAAAQDNGFWLFMVFGLAGIALAAAELIWAVAQTLVRAFL